MIECAHPALAALIIHNRALRALCHPIGDRHLAVPLDQELKLGAVARLSGIWRPSADCSSDQQGARVVQNPRRSHYELDLNLEPGHRLPTAFTETAHALRWSQHLGNLVYVELLVELHAGRIPGLLQLAQMELKSVLGRSVELHTCEDLSPSFRDQVATTAQALYAA